LQIKTTKNDIIQALRTSSAVGMSSTLSTLAAGKLTVVDATKVQIEATDLDMFVVVDVAAEIEGEGEIVFPLKKMLALVETLPDTAVITMSVSNKNKNRLIVRHGGSKNEMAGFPVENFPPSMELPHAHAHVVCEGKELVPVIKRILPMAAKEKDISMFSGIWLDFAEDGVWLVASDRNRLGAERVSDQKARTPYQGIIPQKAFKALAPWIGEGEVGIFVGDTIVEIIAVGAHVRTRQMVGRIPNWRGVFPENFIASAKLPAQEFRQAVEQAAIFEDPAEFSGRVAKMEVLPGRVELSLSSQSGNAFAAIPAETEGSCSRGFFIPSLKGLAKAFTEEEVSLNIAESELMLVSDDAPGFRGVIKSLA
jgi:DNA polymerase III sliding clamp (beta) subunit (PCNA family)